MMVAFFKVQKLFLFLLLLLPATYFTIRGFQQVVKEQISTKTQYRYGDDNDGNLDLLAITICPDSQESLASKFKQDYDLKSIIKDSESILEIEEILQSMILDSNDGSNMYYSKTLETKWIPKWEHILDWQQGHCYTFNPKSEGLTSTPIMSYNVFDNSQIQKMVFNTNESLLITIYDPEGIYTYARNSRGHVFYLPANGEKQFRMTKTIVTSLPTKERPCDDTIYYGKESCIEDQATKRFLDKSGCILPWMKLMHPSIELCEEDNDVLKEAINEYLCAMNQITNDLFNATEFLEKCMDYDPMVSKCNSMRSCHEVILEKQFKSSYRSRDGMSRLWLFWSNPRIVYVEDFISYDFHNFIGEVGGFFGLFLGFSFTSLFGLLEIVQKKMGYQF